MSLKTTILLHRISKHRIFKWMSYPWSAKPDQSNDSYINELQRRYICRLRNEIRAYETISAITEMDEAILLKTFNHRHFQNLKDITTFLAFIDHSSMSEENTSTISTESSDPEKMVQTGATDTLEYYRKHHYHLVARSIQLTEDNKIWLRTNHKAHTQQLSHANFLKLMERGLEPWWSFLPLLNSTVVSDIQSDICDTMLVPTAHLSTISANLGLITFCLTSLNSVIRFSSFTLTNYLNIQVAMPHQKGALSEEQIPFKNCEHENHIIPNALTVIQNAAASMNGVFNITNSIKDNDVCFTIQLPYK